MVSDEGSTYTISGRSLALGQHSLFGQIKKNLDAENSTNKLRSQVFAPADLFEEHNSIMLIGSYFKQQTATGSHPFVFAYNTTTGDVSLLHMVADQQVTLNGFRFYIADVNKDGSFYVPTVNEEGKEWTLDDLFNGIDIRDDDDSGTTDISEVADDDKTQSAYGEGIYDLSGRRVAINTQKDMKSQLPKGVYIVNGKKRIVK